MAVVRYCDLDQRKLRNLFSHRQKSSEHKRNLHRPLLHTGAQVESFRDAAFYKPKYSWQRTQIVLNMRPRLVLSACPEIRAISGFKLPCTNRSSRNTHRHLEITAGSVIKISLINDVLIHLSGVNQNVFHVPDCGQQSTLLMNKPHSQQPSSSIVKDQRICLCAAEWNC